MYKLFLMLLITANVFSTPFTFTVKTNNPGTSNSDQFTLPTLTYSYDYNINWGDGSDAERITSNVPQTHTFIGGAGTYTISIEQNAALKFPTMRFNNGGDRLKLIDITQWGTNSWYDLNRSFYGCANMVISATDQPIFNNPTTLNNTFTDCKSLTKIHGYSYPNVLDIYQTWSGDSGITTIDAGLSLPKVRNIGKGFEYTRITEMPNIPFDSVRIGYYAWRGCKNLVKFRVTSMPRCTTFLEAWYGTAVDSFHTMNISSAITFSSAFSFCSTTVYYDSLYLPNVKDLRYAFRCNFILPKNPGIYAPACTSYHETFVECRSLTRFHPINISNGKLFAWCWNHTSIDSFPELDFSNATDMQYTFGLMGTISHMESKNFPKANNMTGFFYQGTCATSDYSDILINLAANNTNNSVVLGGGSSKYYYPAISSRANLVSRSWTITDGGVDAYYLSNTHDAHGAITYLTDSIAGYGETIRIYFTVDAGYVGSWNYGSYITGIDSNDVVMYTDSAITASTQLIPITPIITSIKSQTRRDYYRLNCARPGDVVTIKLSTDIVDSSASSAVYLGRDTTGAMQITRWFNNPGSDTDSVWCVVPTPATLNVNYRPIVVSGSGMYSEVRVPVTWREQWILNVKGWVR